ncbi:DEXDc helicase-primase [Bodo saltans virus]|uniref:DEXDc helicase-primase n=1 Tax=Bodo saltans virus TaxID=2024608 RepID=A0A2H4UWD6_9VIRU|nr:DEXDc helicase-primase [Bodo saltans virus]ATZ81253.1 DEXDc helicase-primase [Bodo saltans virus]
MSIKSAYGTGKTSFLKNFLNMLDLNDHIKYKKVLFISYRRSLSYDVQRQLSDFGFENYIEVQKKGNYLHEIDKLIIQYESLHKILSHSYDMHDDPNQINYDLIIIDECESVLSQVDSTTNGENQRDNYNIFREFVKKSKKMIVLDGDISNKTYNFIHTFSNNNVLIKNTYCKPKKIYITKNYDKYIKSIHEDLKQNKKLYICCMSSSDGYALEENIKKHFDKITIKFINADISDDEKEKIYKDVNEEWKQFDVIITTPITEAGVSFDELNYFHRTYAILSAGSTTPRGLMQMLNRVRYPVNNDAIIYANKLKLHNNIIFYTYNDVKKMIYENIRDEKHYMPYITDDTKGFILKNDSNYLTNYIFNKTEKLNAQQFYFLGYFKLLCKEKNIDLFFEDEKGKEKFITKNIKKENILNANNITAKEYDELSKKIKRCQNITEKERYEFLKYNYFVVKLKNSEDSLINLSEEQIDEFEYFYKNKNTQKNFFLLIDEMNGRKYNFDANNNYSSLEKINEINDVKEFLNLYEVKNPAETSELCDFKEKMDKNKLMNIFNDNNTRVKNKNKDSSEKKMLWNLKNTLLKFGIELKSDGTQKRINGKRIRFNDYHLTLNNSFHNILKKTISTNEINDSNNFLHNLTDKININNVTSLFDDNSVENELYNTFEIEQSDVL